MAIVINVWLDIFSGEVFLNEKIKMCDYRWFGITILPDKLAGMLLSDTLVSGVTYVLMGKDWQFLDELTIGQRDQSLHWICWQTGTPESSWRYCVLNCPGLFYGEPGTLSLWDDQSFIFTHCTMLNLLQNVTAVPL